MLRKIVRADDEQIISLPEELLDALHLAEGEEVSVEFDALQRTITITRPDAVHHGVDAEFARQVAEFIEQYRPALEALAQ